ncbi:MAG: hypothetical protein Q8K75_11305 [Chlamydiales bacterium]|nr:hypothetical protein [Chlamydiales bacterium]
MKAIFVSATFALLIAIVSCSQLMEKRKVQEPAAKTGYLTWDFFDGSRNKSLHAALWYPVKDDVKASEVVDSDFQRVPEALGAPIADINHKYPLIVMSAGYGGRMDSLAWLAEYLVANGYIVASVEHGDLAADGTQHLNMWNRPLDISSLLDSIFASSMAKYIDTNRIGMIGYSVGGLTGAWLAGAVRPDIQPENLVPPKGFGVTAEDEQVIGKYLNQVDIEGWRRSYRDPRIKSYVLLAPYLSWAFDTESYKKMSSDMLIIVGDADPSRESSIKYAQSIPQASFKELDGHIGHWEFMGVWSQKGFETIKSMMPQEAWPSLPLEHRRRFVHELTGELTVEFFNHNL